MFPPFLRSWIVHFVNSINKIVLTIEQHDPIKSCTRAPNKNKQDIHLKNGIKASILIVSRKNRFPIREATHTHERKRSEDVRGDKPQH